MYKIGLVIVEQISIEFEAGIISDEVNPKHWINPHLQNNG